MGGYLIAQRRVAIIKAKDRSTGDLDLGMGTSFGKSSKKARQGRLAGYVQLVLIGKNAPIVKLEPHIFRGARVEWIAEEGVSFSGKPEGFITLFSSYKHLNGIEIRKLGKVATREHRLNYRRFQQDYQLAMDQGSSRDASPSPQSPTSSASSYQTAIDRIPDPTPQPAPESTTSAAPSHQATADSNRSVDDVQEDIEAVGADELVAEGDEDAEEVTAPLSAVNTKALRKGAAWVQNELQRENSSIGATTLGRLKLMSSTSPSAGQSAGSAAGVKRKRK